MNCNRCDWRPDQSDSEPWSDQLAAHAVDAGHWLCTCCGRSLTRDETANCETCLTDVRSHLAGVLLMFDELPHHLRTVAGSTLSGPRGGADGHPLPGGRVLALLGPGSPGGAARRLTRTDLERGTDGREHRIDNLPTDTPSVAWSLASWEDSFRHERADDPAMTGTSIPRMVRGAGHYLDVHARWAANHHPAFADFCEDLRSLHATLEEATHRRRRPTRAGADCFDCGGDLIRRVVDGLEEDHVTCVRCHTQYDPGRYRLALKAAAEGASRMTWDGQRWATPSVLAAELGRSEHTIRSWAQREHVRSHVRAGVLYVHVDDVTSRHAPRRSA